MSQTLQAKRDYQRRYHATKRDELNLARRMRRLTDGEKIRAAARAKYARNRLKIREREKEKWAHNKVIVNRKQNARRHRISLDEYDRLMACACGICGTRENLHIDHCHNSGRIRGVLCTRCNTGIGLFRESHWFLRKAIQYLAEQPPL